MKRVIERVTEQVIKREIERVINVKIFVLMMFDISNELLIVPVRYT